MLDGVTFSKVIPGSYSFLNSFDVHATFPKGFHTRICIHC
jgi:hypothetical protein